MVDLFGGGWFVVLLVVGGLWLLRAWLQGGYCTASTRLDGKTVVITGANSGIGKICAQELSKRGAKVVMLCRSVQRGEAAARDIRAASRGEVIVEQMDLSSLSSVRAAGKRLLAQLDRVDILLNNAGIMCCPYQKTEDGLEIQIGTNHFGHFLLTNLLLPLIKKAAPGARIVTVSSRAHERSGADIRWDDINFEKEGTYTPMTAYRQSKLANVLFSNALAKRVKHEGITCYSLHPGWVDTDLGRYLEESIGLPGKIVYAFIRPFVKTPLNGSQTSLYCCLEPSLSLTTGKYYTDCRERQPSPAALRSVDGDRLWELSKKITKFDE